MENCLFLGRFSDQERQFVERETSLLVARRMDDGSVSGVMSFIFTFGLVNHVSLSSMGDAYRDRYCYDRDEFSIFDLIEVLSAWDGESLPRSGWLKYKGAAGEFGPSGVDNLQKALRAPSVLEG